ncbi:MAG: hypothetical protein AAFX81_12580 [Pseudomonadota bacterium]
MAFAPRVAFGGCDRLRPFALPCDAAGALSFLVPNIFAVAVFAFLSGRTVPTPPLAHHLVVRALRMWLAAAFAAVFTVAVTALTGHLSVDLARQFAPLGVTHPLYGAFTATPD